MAVTTDKIDDPYEYRLKDLKSTDDKVYLNENFLKTDAGGNYFDLKGNVIRNSEPYYEDLCDDNDLVHVSKNTMMIKMPNKTLPSMINHVKMRFSIPMEVNQ